MDYNVALRWEKIENQKQQVLLLPNFESFVFFQ